MPITFEVIHTCLTIHNAHTYEVLSDGYKYFTFSNHLFLHIYDHLPTPQFGSHFSSLIPVLLILFYQKMN